MIHDHCKKTVKQKDLVLVIIFLGTFLVIPFIQSDFQNVVTPHSGKKEMDAIIGPVKKRVEFKAIPPSKEEIEMIQSQPLDLPPTKRNATVLPPPPPSKHRTVTRLTPDFVSRVVPPPIHLYKPSYCESQDEATEIAIETIETHKLLKLPRNVTYPKVYKKGEVFHIIKIRFMQHQPTLLELGKARLELFKAFCLPSMIHQTSQNFFWIIYTDPKLDSQLLDELKKLLAPYPHFYVLPSLMDKRGQGGKDILRHFSPSDFIMGDTDMLFANVKYIHWLPVLESRFDADDSLNIHFVEEVQKHGYDVFVKEKGGRDWMFWCINEAAEWHWVGPGNRKSLQSYGALINSRNYAADRFCHTPGLTVGVARGTFTRNVAKSPHHALYENLKEEDTNCGASYHGTQCLEFITKFDQCALRSRTPTSASMANVNSLGRKLTKAAAEEAVARWTYVIENFAVLPSAIKQVNDHFRDKMGDILQDAVLGQCTIGHSCRPEAQQELDDLKKLITEGGEDVETAVSTC